MTLPLPNEQSGGVWIRIQHRFGARMMEWFYAAHTFLFGATLLIFAGVFDQPSWRGFESLMTQPNLGLIMAFLGLARIGGLVVNGAKRHITPWIRVISAACGFLIFLGITFGFASSGVGSTWLAIYPLFALGELVNMYRAAHDAGESNALN